jgi:hypothetical protein
LCKKTWIAIVSDMPEVQVAAVTVLSGEWSCYTGRYLVEIERNWAALFSGVYR